MDFLERNQLSRLSVSTLVDLRRSSVYETICWDMSWEAHGCIGAFTQLGIQISIGPAPNCAI